MSLLRGLLQQIEALARRQGAERITVVRLRLGPLAHIEPGHLRKRFIQAARGTVAESARLDIETTDELHEPRLTHYLLDKIRNTITQPWTIMEAWGGQSHTLIRTGIDQLIPEGLRLVHGPGCPVCVTPLELIDRALAIGACPAVIFCSFGDMLRVPGTSADLLRVRTEGGEMRIVYSPLDDVLIAQVVFFAVGFETTAPATALAVWQAERMRLSNFSLLVAHLLVPPAMEAILTPPANRVQAFLAAGHVCTVMGYEDYLALAERHRIPFVVTGFEPVDLLEGILMVVRQLEAGRYEVENKYARWVHRGGNRAAQEIIAKVYEICDRPWRGLSVLPHSGLHLRVAYHAFDSEARLGSRPSPLVNRPSAAAVRCFKDIFDPTSVLPLAPAAHRTIPLVPQWYLRKEPARPTGSTGGSRKRRLLRRGRWKVTPETTVPNQSLDTNPALACPPKDCVHLAHGEVARLTRRLIHDLFLEVFDYEFLRPLADGAVLPAVDRPLVMTTDSVVPNSIP
jgi:hydrogenase expression/formation protein HypD